MPETPNTQGSPRLLTVPEITERYGISRQAIHTYRQRGVFPQPAPEQGSTRLRFREDEVDAFFVANPKRPGRRTDRETAGEGDTAMPEPVNLDAEHERIERLEKRVKELEEALLYLSNTLGMHGVLETVERRPATQAYNQGEVLAEDLPDWGEGGDSDG